MLVRCLAASPQQRTCPAPTSHPLQLAQVMWGKVTLTAGGSEPCSTVPGSEAQILTGSLGAWSSGQLATLCPLSPLSSVVIST